MVNRIFATVTLLIAGIFYYESGSFAEKTGVQTFAPSFYPRVILSIMTVMAIALLIQSFINKTNHAGNMYRALKKYFIEHWRVPVIMICFFLYLAIMPAAGFIISTIFFLSAGFLMLMPLKISNIVTSVILTFAMSYGIQFVFQNGLNIVLP